MSMLRFLTSKLPQGGCGQFDGRRSVVSDGVVQTTVTVERHHGRHRFTARLKVVEPAGIGTRWHDTPTSKPPASQPNSTSAGTVTRQEVTDFMKFETGDPC